MKKTLLVLFDGNALIHRAFHALPPLTLGKTGEPVSAVYGFTMMLLKVLGELKPTHIAVAFDKKAPTFRHKLYEQYKATRPETPDELVVQFDRVRELVRAFNIPIHELDGFEADDVLGTLSLQAAGQDVDTIIVTGDADTMQLVSPKVKVLYPKARRTFSDTMQYDESAVSEKYGVKPSQIADLKALAGDPSDNIPGVKGIGDKTATKLLQQFGSVEGIYEHIDEVAPAKLQALLRDNEAVARQSKELATIKTDAPVTLDLEQSRVSHYDRSKVADLFREMEFSSLLSKLPETEEIAEAGAKGKSPATVCHIIDTTDTLDDLLRRLSMAKSLVFDTETTSLDAMSARLVGISLSLAAGEAYYIPVGHTDGQQLPLAEVLERMRPLLEDPASSKVAQNGKYDMTVLAEHGVMVSNLSFDTMLAAYLLGDKSLDLKSLAFSKLGVEMTPITELIGSGAKQVPMSRVPIEKVAD
ncbi:MAG: DNA polymerase I, partial [Chloroflexi bacterium]|nr:DNA polymerase I [Chloroflexota bacterium]